MKNNSRQRIFDIYVAIHPTSWDHRCSKCNAIWKTSQDRTLTGLPKSGLYLEVSEFYVLLPFFFALTRSRLTIRARIQATISIKTNLSLLNMMKKDVIDIFFLERIVIPSGMIIITPPVLLCKLPSSSLKVAK